MFGSLRKKLEEATAQLNPFDGGKTAATVRASRNAVAPAQTVKQPLTTQQRVNQSYGGGFGGVKNRFRDVFDANTEADKIKRFSATGLAESYRQEQDRKNQAALNDPTKRSTLQQISGNALGGISEFAKVPSQAMKMKGAFENSTIGKALTFANPTTQASAIGDELWKRATGQDTAKKRNDMFQKVGGNTEQIISDKIQQSGLGNRNADNRIVAGVSRAGGQLLGQAAATVATGGSTLPSAAMGLQTASSEYDKARQAGKSNDYAVNVGLGQGTASAISEKLGMDKLFGGAGGKIASLARGFATEGLQEGSQQFIQNAIANRTYNPNQGLKDGVAESALIGGITGGAAGPLLGGSRPTKPTTSLVSKPTVGVEEARQRARQQFAPQPTATRTTPHTGEAAILSDYQEALYGKVDPRTLNQIHRAARGIADRYGLDITSGSVYDINARISDFIENGVQPSQPAQSTTNLVQRVKSKIKPLNTGGYIAGPLALDFSKAQAEGKVFEGVDGKPRFEVDDSGAKIKNPNGQTVGEILDHPELFKNYPELKSIKVDRNVNAGAGGQFDAKTNTLSMTDTSNKSTLLHEIQHAIQAKESFASGGDPIQLGDPAKAKFIEAEFDKFKKKYPDANKVDFILNNRDYLNYGYYKRLAGEAEARAVQTRMNMPMSERYTSRPLAKDEVVLYHRTSKQNADAIKKSGKFLSKENTGEIFLSNKPDGQNIGYGDTVVPVRVKKSDVRLDDEFPSGEQHFAVENTKAEPYTPQSTFYDSLDVPKQDLIIRNDGGKAMSVEKDPLESLKQEASLYRGMNATEWNDVFNGGVSANKKNGLAFVGSKDDAVMATEAYGRAGKKGNVIVEYKPEARKKLVSGENLGQNTGGSNLSGEYQAKGLGLSDIARVTDENGKVIYEATQSQPPKSTPAPKAPKPVEKTPTYYHGTRADNDFDKFDFKKSGTSIAGDYGNNVHQGNVAYFTKNKDSASIFAREATDRYDMGVDFENFIKRKTHIKDGNVLEFKPAKDAKIKKLDHRPDLAETNKLKQQGYDGVEFDDKEAWTGFSDGRWRVPEDTTTVAVWNTDKLERVKATQPPKSTPKKTSKQYKDAKIMAELNAQDFTSFSAEERGALQDLTNEYVGKMKGKNVAEAKQIKTEYDRLISDKFDGKQWTDAENDIDYAIQEAYDNIRKAPPPPKSTPTKPKVTEAEVVANQNNRHFEGSNADRPLPDYKAGDKVSTYTMYGEVSGVLKKVPDYNKSHLIKGNDFVVKLDKPLELPNERGTLKEIVTDGRVFKTIKKATPFEQNLQTAGLAPKKAKGLVVSETKPLNGQKIQKVRTAPGEVEQRVVQDRSDEIADALGIPAKDRVPTADSQRAERVDTAAQNGLENIKNNPEIVRQAAAPSTLKDKTKRKTFEEATKKYLGGTRSAEIERQATIASLNKEFKLSDKEKINAIISRDDPSVPALNEKVMRYNDRFKQLTDAAYKSYTDQGVKMGYVSSYLPRIYKNPETGQEVDLPEFKALIQGSKRMKGREAEKVAVDWLVEKDPTKLLERYYKSMDNAVAGRQYMKDLEDNGLVIASTEPVRGMRPVIAEGLQTDGKVFYAQKDVAHKLNELFGSKEATNLVEKTLEKAAGVNSLFQSFVLSGGVPNTPINAFGMMQLLKEGMALHPIKAGRAFFGGGLSKSYANKVFTAKKDVMKLMAQNDLDIRVNLEQTGKWGNERIRDAFKNEGKAAGLNQAWNEFTNDATFGRFMPMLEVLHFENVYKHQLRGGLIRKPKSPAEAARIAAESTKNFYGKTSVYKTSTRSKAVDDAAGALLLAPRFREAMVNFWVKNAKALVPTNYGKAEYRDNHKFMVASAVMYAAMTMLNEAMNGARMDENPDGKKDKLIMPASVAGKFGIDTKGKDIAVPFLPSIATVPRNLASLGANLATGKFNEAGKNAKAFASMPVKTIGDILTNEDYFGNKIVQDDSSPIQKFTQAASYVASSNMQPWIREALNAKGQKWDKETKKTWGIKEKSTFEALSNAGELPLRFYKPDTYRYGENWTPKGGKDEKFDFKQQRERAALGGEIKNISKTLKLNKRQDELFKSLSSVEFNDDGTLKEDNNPFYKSQRYTALQDDGVFEAMKQKSKLNAKLNGKPIDPIFSDDLAPDQRRVLLWKKTLPPGTSDPTVKKLYEQDWYQDYRNKESAYFDSKKAWNKKMGYKDATPNTNEYPMASKEVEDAQNAYFALPKGTGDRSSFIRNNPEIWNKMIAFWDSKDAWTNGERSKLGLGAVDDEDSGGFSYGSKRGGRGGRSGSKYDYTKNLFASGGGSGSTSKQLRAILQKAMSGKSK